MKYSVKQFLLSLELQAYLLSGIPFPSLGQHGFTAQYYTPEAQRSCILF